MTLQAQFIAQVHAAQVLALPIAQADQQATEGLTQGGAMIMTASILLVTTLLTFCIVKIFREPHPETHHHVPLDIDTKDYN